MKTLTTLILFWSLGLSAQVVTGGGGTKGQVQIDSSDEGGSAPSEISKVVRAYTSHLKARDVACRTLGPKYLDFDPDIMQVYYKLKLVKTDFMADPKCIDAQAYYTCLNDEEAKKRLKKLQKHEKFLEYMKENYKLEKKDAKDVLKFFEKLGEDERPAT